MTHANEGEHLFLITDFAQLKVVIIQEFSGVRFKNLLAHISHPVDTHKTHTCIPVKYHLSFHQKILKNVFQERRE